MITIKTDYIGFTGTAANFVGTATAAMTDRSAVVSACSLGFSASLLVNGSGLGNGTGLSGAMAATPAVALRAGLPVRGMERVERPTKALVAAAAGDPVKGYAFAAASADNTQQTKQHPTKWAFRGHEPWSDPA